MWVPTAGSSNLIGSATWGIGVSAGPSIYGLTNARALGYNARVSQSNSLVLGGTGASAVNVGIGTTAPSSLLDVRGTFRLGTAGTALSALIKGTANLAAYTSSPGSTQEVTFAVAGATTDAAVSVSPNQQLPDGLAIAYARVSATGVVAVGLANTSGSSVSVPALSFRMVVMQ